MFIAPCPAAVSRDVRAGPHRPSAKDNMTTARAPYTRLALAALFGAFALGAQAAIVVATSGITGATQTQTFASPSLGDGTVVTNQFAGLTISPTAGGAVRYNGCGSGAFGAELPSANYIGTFGPGCSVNSVDDSFSMVFDQAVSAASFALRDYRAGGTNTFTALLDGVVVDTFAHDATTDYGAGGYIFSQTSPVYLKFTGTVFNEIRYRENGAQGYVILTNVAWTTASSVPEPGSLALAGLALSALVAAGRRKA